MSRTTHVLCASIAAVALLLAAAAVDGATFFDLSDDELFERTPLIVVGHIAAAKAVPGPAVEYRVELEQAVRGAPPAALIVRLPGGVRAGLALTIPGTPRLRPGERTLLFLRPQKDGRFALSHLFLGAFAIATAEDGTEVAVREPHGQRLRRPGNGNKAGAGFDRDLERFVRWLADRGRGDRRPPDYFLPRQATKDAARGSAKWEPIVSSSEPEPFGCGQTGGHQVRWFDFGDGGSVGWRTHFNGQEGLPDGGMDRFRSALDTWSDDPNSGIELEFLGLTDSENGFAGVDGLNTLLFGDPRDQIPGTVEDTGLLALGGPWFLCELREHRGELFHPIIEADIVTQEGLEAFFAASPNPRRAAEEIFAHELGHTLGFAHTADPEALMYAIAHDDGRGAALDVEDLGGAFGLYGDGEPPLIPTAPADLAITAVFATAVQLAWSDLSAGESNFRLERRQGDDVFVPVAAVAADREAYFDTGVAPETSYSYRIRAQNAAGASGYSAEVAVTTTEDPRPDPPSNLRAAPLSSRRIRLSWQDNSDDETSFALFLLDGATSNFVEVPYAIPVDTTTVLLNALQPDVKYTFRVRARNRSGTSGASNTAVAATFADDDGCVASETELCLLGGRFRVELAFVDPGPAGGSGPGARIAGGVERDATAIPNTDQTGLFWFFEPGNVELIVKMLDGSDTNGHFWVFFGGITDLELRLEITDTASGRTASYLNPRGEICGGADITAFVSSAEPAARVATLPRLDAPKAATPDLSTLEVTAITLITETAASPKAGASAPDPALTAGDCTPGPGSLCLLDGRLQVEVDWRNPHDGGSEGDGQAVVLSDGSGYFWFFAPENLELVVKALDGRGFNGHLWLFYGALTDLEYWITVTDTVTGAHRVYHSPPGELCGAADILAFELDP
ncbi:MAG: fibronectin type III domain-containing protein [Thermoanaerobaculia bacterium]